MHVRFQVSAHTYPGEQLFLVGSSTSLGAWDPSQALPLQTNSSDYPLWWVEVESPEAGLREPEVNQEVHQEAKIEYQYLRRSAQGIVWESLGVNRWIPIEKNQNSETHDPETPPAQNVNRIVVVDGWFGEIPVWPHSYWQDPPLPSPTPQGGRTILVLGSSVALGSGAWLLRGWASRLGESLGQRYRLINESQLGATVALTHARFGELVDRHQPDMVIIALSLANQGFPQATLTQQARIQRQFESGLLHLVERTHALGALAVVGGLYPHQDYTSDHYAGLRHTQARMNSWGIPVLDWLSAVDDGHGHWQPGLAWDAGHPNSRGHQRMFESIDLSLFASQDRSAQPASPLVPIPIFQDPGGLQISRSAYTLQLQNPSPYSYGLCPNWVELQTAVQAHPNLLPGLYVSSTLPALALSEQRRLLTHLNIPAQTQGEWRPATYLLHQHQVLFDDGQVGILRDADGSLHLLNESAYSYNIHPMWREVRLALKGVCPGVYEDPQALEAEFRTAMIGPSGLESRVKLPPYSYLCLTYQGSLATRQRIGILPLGDRCAVRMMLYKMEYDGPAFPFDLTRTLYLSDVADIIDRDFVGMWDPDSLDYRPEAHRIYHRRWQGLSFAHEVEGDEDPSRDMSPVYARMQRRYQARAERFRYTIQHADQILFVRTGLAQRAEVEDLIHKLSRWGKSFRLLILSDQSGAEFMGLPGVIHHALALNPDRMYEDEQHWLVCTEEFRRILNALGVTSRTLFWCPPTSAVST